MNVVRPWPRRLHGLIAALALGMIGAGAARAEIAGYSVEVRATRITLDAQDGARRQFGRLTLLCAVALTSTAADFGGYSGLAVDADGKRLLAISDAGTWLTASLVHDGACIKGLADARIWPVLGRDGKPIQGKRNKDAEALALAEHGRLSGSVYVAFEHHHRIWRYRLKDGVPSGRPEAVKFRARNVRSNSGVEGLARLRGGPWQGALLALAESGPDGEADEGVSPGWLIREDKQQALAIALSDGFKITGLEATADGGVIVLERRYKGLLGGVHMRLRRIASKDIKPGAVLTGETLVEIGGYRYGIDNMEAIALHETAAGQQVLTLLSDDNFNPWQRTVLLQFALPETDD